MKRIFTLVVAVLCCAVVFAQANYSQHLMRNASRTQVSKKIEKPNKTREGEIWSCTFEDPTTYTVGQVTASNGNWELQTKSEYSGENYFWSLNSTDPDHPYGDVSETPEHWMMIDPGNAARQGFDFDSYILFTGIDLSEAQYPQICFYEYRQIFNIPPSTEATVIEFSTNGGATWTTQVVGCESTSEGGFAYKRVPIFDAAGHDNVMIRFRAKRTESIISGYFTGAPTYAQGQFIVHWQVDDVIIEEAMPFDLVITDYRMNKGICDYYSNPDAANQGYGSQHYQLRPLFGQTPRSEWTSENMFASFNVAVENRGSEDVEPIVNITITGPNGEEIWTVDFEGDLVGPYGRDTIDVIEYVGEGVDKVFFFTEEQMQNIALGEYTVTYTVSTEAGEDPTPANNTASHPFYITESAYCPATPNITTSMGPNNWSDFEDGDEIIGMFEYYSLPDNEIPVYVFISANTNAGTAIAANIYEYNATNDAFELTVTSGTYTISENDLGKWINIPLESPLMLEEFDAESSDKTIEVGIAFFENGQEELHLGASRDMPTKGWICRYNMGDGVTAYNVTSESNAPAICLGDPTDVVSVATSEANEITMYPNPSNGIVNFTNVENATIEVYNMMGQVVASESNVSENASIDLSGVANGNYIVRIVKNGEIATSKLSIVK